MSSTCCAVVIIFFISISGHGRFASFQLMHADATSSAADSGHRFGGLVTRSYSLIPQCNLVHDFSFGEEIEH